MIFPHKPLILHDNSAEMMWPYILLFGISGGEILILLLLVLILFGPKKIPEIARMVGKGMNEVKKVQREINSEISRYSSEIDNEVRKMEPDDRKKLSEPVKAQMADKKQDPYYSGVYPAGEPGDKSDANVSSMSGEASAPEVKGKVKSAGTTAPVEKDKAKAGSTSRPKGKSKTKSVGTSAPVEKTKASGSSRPAGIGKPGDKGVLKPGDQGKMKGSGKKDNSGKA